MNNPENIGNRWASDFSVVPSEVEAEFDEGAAVYDRNLESWGYRPPRDSAAILSKYVSKSAGILDAGCGTGLVGSELKRLDYQHLYGCDISNEMINVTREKDLYFELKRADPCEPLPFDDNKFEAATCLGTLSFSEDSEPAFREFCRVTRPDGIVLFSQHCDLFESRDCQSLLEKLESAGLWRREFHSDANPYLPAHAANSDQLQVRYFVYRISKV